METLPQRNGLKTRGGAALILDPVPNDSRKSAHLRPAGCGPAPTWAHRCRRVWRGDMGGTLGDSKM